MRLNKATRLKFIIYFFVEDKALKNFFRSFIPLILIAVCIGVVKAQDTERVGIRVKKNIPVKTADLHSELHESDLDKFVNAIPKGWLADAVSMARYEIIMDVEVNHVEQCGPYGNFPFTASIYREQIDVVISILDLETKNEVAKQIFQGHKPKLCANSESFASTITGSLISKTYTGEINAEGFGKWLTETAANLPGLLKGEATTLAPKDKMCGTLNSFIEQVNAESGKTFTTKQVQQLVDNANQSKTLIGCP